MLPKFIVCCLSFVVFAFSASPAFAQTATQSSESQLPSTVSPVSPLYTDLLVSNMFHTFSCLTIGQSVIGQPCLTYHMTKNAQGIIQGVPMLSQANLSGGALGATTSLIGALYQNPPVRTADYLASVGHGLGIVKTANAQVTGSGEQVLSPILGLWQVSRNISYVLLIIIFLVIGLMVMFRNKLNPQTVITAQTALPGLVIGLILITFSYFLAGLISDMAFVGTNVVGYYFAAAQGPTALADPTRLNLTQKLADSNITHILGSFTGIFDSGEVANFTGTIFESLGDQAKHAIQILAFWLSSQFISPMIPTNILVNSPWGLLIKPLVSLFLGGGIAAFGISPLLGLLLSFAASLALVYMAIKLLLKLIMAWLTIIFLTISAPFQFLFASLPGRQGMATGWMLSMLGNILIFPAVIAVIYFVAFILGDKYTNICAKDAAGHCLLQVSNSNQINNNGFMPPVYAQAGDNIVGPNAFPLFGGMDLSFVKILLAFGALMALPSIPDIITRSIGKMGQTGGMIGQEIMGSARFGQGYAQRTYQAGIGTAGDIRTGLTGQTQVTATGDLVMSQQGLLRRGVGSVTEGSKLKGAATPGRWVMPWRKNKDIK